MLPSMMNSVQSTGISVVPNLMHLSESACHYVRNNVNKKSHFILAANTCSEGLLGRFWDGFGVPNSSSQCLEA